MHKLLFALLLISSSLFSQDNLHSTKLPDFNKAKINWAEEIKMGKYEFYDYIIDATDNDVHFLKKTKKGYSIEIQDKDLNIIKNSPLDMKLEKKYLIMEGVFAFGDDIIVLGSKKQKKTKTNNLYYTIIDRNNLGSKMPWKLLGDMSYERRKQIGGFSYTLSNDKSKLLLYFSKPYAGKGFPEKFGFKVFDLGMKLLWEKDIKLKYNEELFAIRDFIISNNADVYVLGSKSNLIQKGFSKKVNDLEFHILSYSKNDIQKDFELRLNDKHIQDITFNINNKNQLICAGFYSENEALSHSIKGTFYLVLDTETKKAISLNTKEIDEGFITEDWSDRAIKKAKRKKEKTGKAIEAYKFDLKDFVLHEDGGATLLAEQYYVKVTSTTSTDSNGRTTTRTTYHYYYNDIYIINMTPTGEIEWISKINKHQHSTNDGGYRSSYALSINKDKLYLIYNLSTKNYYEKEVWKSLPKKERKNYLTLISEVEPNGDINDHLLLNNTKEEIFLVPKFCDQFDENRLLLYTSYRRNVRLGILEYK